MPSFIISGNVMETPFLLGIWQCTSEGHKKVYIVLPLNCIFRANFLKKSLRIYANIYLQDSLKGFTFILKNYKL